MEQLVWPWWQCSEVGGQLPCFQSCQISSNPIEHMFGVHKGSVLGAIGLLCILPDTAMDIDHQLYADETKVYISFNTASFRNSTKKWSKFVTATHISGLGYCYLRGQCDSR